MTESSDSEPLPSPVSTSFPCNSSWSDRGAGRVICVFGAEQDAALEPGAPVLRFLISRSACMSVSGFRRFDNIRPRSPSFSLELLVWADSSCVRLTWRRRADRRDFLNTAFLSEESEDGLGPLQQLRARCEDHILPESCRVPCRTAWDLSDPGS